MDHTRDNPLKRFTAFWIAILLVASFGIACLIVRPITHARVDSAVKAAADDRRAIRAQIDSAQEQKINRTSLDKALQSQAQSLLTSKPTPVKPQAASQ